MQSVAITTNVSSNPVHGKVYLIKHYVIKFDNDLRQVSGFSPGTPISSTNTNKFWFYNEINEMENVILHLTKVTIN